MGGEQKEKPPTCVGSDYTTDALPLYNLERMADMAGYGHIGKVIDKLTRNHMLILSRAAKMPAKHQEPRW